MTQDAPAFSAGELLTATGGTAHRGGADWSCRGISTDTRTIRPGNLFIALLGENFDGHDCLAAAADRGAAGLLVRTDRLDKLPPGMDGVPVITVPDTLEGLGAIARSWRLRFPIPLVAITGSSGKTTTKEMIAAIAARSRNILKTEGNLNNLIGLPRTLLGLNDRHETAIVEMGTNCPGEIARLAAIAAPDIGLITNIGPAHLEGLGSIEAVREEKGALFDVMAGRGTALINADDREIALIAARWRGDRITFGLTPDADVAARQIEAAGAAGVSFELVIAGMGTPVRIPVCGMHNVRNALAAAAAARALGFDRQEIAAGLAAFLPVPGRMEIRRMGTGIFIIMDVYNANPASMREALLTMQGLRGAGRAIAILGDMLELGEQARELHEGVGTILAETGVDRVFLKGSLSPSVAAGAVKSGLPGENIVFFEGPGEAAGPLRSYLKRGDWVLIKGSRRMKMEAVAEALIAAFDVGAETV